MKYHYFVSYVSTNGGVLTYGHCGIDRSKPIECMDDVTEMSVIIAEKNGFKSATIISYIELER